MAPPLIIGPSGCGKLPLTNYMPNGGFVVSFQQHKPDYGKTAFHIAPRTKDKDKELDRRINELYYESECDEGKSFRDKTNGVFAVCTISKRAVMDVGVCCSVDEVKGIVPLEDAE